MDQKTRTNAMISYFFLGWMFLLAKNNPNFNNDFVKVHSKNATKIHVIFLVIYIVYSFFLIRLINFKIPLVPLSLDQIIMPCMGLVFTIIILRGAYRAHRGEGVEDIHVDKFTSAFKNNTLVSTGDFSETDKMIYLSSYFPFFGIIVGGRQKNNYIEQGVKVGGVFSFLIICMYVFGNSSSLLTILIFVYILYIVFVGVSLFINNKLIHIGLIDKIPNLTEIYVILRTLPVYSGDIVSAVFGKKENINFKERLLETLKKDEEYKNSIKETYIDEKLFVNKYLIFVPIVNFILLPKVFISKKSIYFIQIIQGITITIIIMLMVYFYPGLQLFMLFPIFLGIANLGKDLSYRIPGVYELGAIVSFIFSWIFLKLNFLRGKRKEHVSVNFKV